MPALLPISNMSAVAPGENGAGEPSVIPSAPKADELRDWQQESYDLDTTTASSLGFPVGQTSVSTSRRVLIFQTSRSRDVEDSGHIYRFGVALRVVVEIDDAKGSGGLTLPVAAAKVELEGARATSQLSVQGYRGDDLGSLMPAWVSFGVDQYAGYMQTVSALQAKIMTNSTAIDPTLLSTSKPPVVGAAPPVADAVALVYGLDAVAHGLTLEDALRRLPDLDDHVMGVVREVYGSRVGGDERTRPDPGRSDSAKRELGGLRLRHGMFI